MKNTDKIADQVGNDRICNDPILTVIPDLVCNDPILTVIPDLVCNDPILTVIPDLIGDLIRIIWKREYRPTW